ncbi:hypothetical protein Nmel_007682 [Mimus melanotis]
MHYEHYTICKQVLLLKAPSAWPTSYLWAGTVSKKGLKNSC